MQLFRIWSSYHINTILKSQEDKRMNQKPLNYKFYSEGFNEFVIKNGGIIRYKEG